MGLVGSRLVRAVSTIDLEPVARIAVVRCLTGFSRHEEAFPVRSKVKPRRQISCVYSQVIAEGFDLKDGLVPVPYDPSSACLACITVGTTV